MTANLTDEQVKLYARMMRQAGALRLPFTVEAHGAILALASMHGWTPAYRERQGI